jgi:hypothetical protein
MEPVGLSRRQAGRVVLHDELLDYVWHASRQRSGALAQLKDCVWRLRAEIEPDPHHPRYPLTERGFGYRLVSVPGPSQPDPASGGENRVQTETQSFPIRRRWFPFNNLRLNLNYSTDGHLVTDVILATDELRWLYL